MKWFTRYGVEYEGKVSNINKKQDSGEFTQLKACSRCGGAGKSDQWARTGKICYKCNGAGNVGLETIKVYTKEKLDKLDASQAKREAKRMVEFRANQLEETIKRKAKVLKTYEANKELIDKALPLKNKNTLLNDLLEKMEAWGTLTEPQLILMAKVVSDMESRLTSPSKHVGEIGERIEVEVTVTKVVRKEVESFGYNGGTELLKITNMIDREKNEYVVMSTSFRVEEGASFKLKGTVKKHTEFNHVKQSQLQRAKVM